ncbi:EndoU domain-containing protein [Frankia sp. AgPm24]|uniref:EndoU domain-containing protein n=1 Tax=Frankia sp. AgPm24 TaxID=631128 RepID=UPI0020107C0C|nr:EndoU domain-containing protein [Frankia sp. AgPm24]
MRWVPMPRDRLPSGADVSGRSSDGASDLSEQITGAEAKAQLLDRAVARGAGNPDPEETSGSDHSADSDRPGASVPKPDQAGVSTDRAGSPADRAGAVLRGPETKAQALDRLVLGPRAAEPTPRTANPVPHEAKTVSADDLRRLAPAPAREVSSAERSASLLDQAVARLRQADQRSSAAPGPAPQERSSTPAADQSPVREPSTGKDRPTPTDQRPPIPEKVFTHILDGEWNKKGRPTGFHSAPDGVAPPDRRLTRIGDPSPEGVYRAKVDFLEPGSGEWREKKVPKHTMFPDSWSREKVREAVQKSYEDVYDSTLAPMLKRGENLVGEQWRGSYEGVHIKFFVGQDGAVRTAFPDMDEG